MPFYFLLDGRRSLCRKFTHFSQTIHTGGAFLRNMCQLMWSNPLKMCLKTEAVFIFIEYTENKIEALQVLGEVSMSRGTSETKGE